MEIAVAAREPDFDLAGTRDELQLAVAGALPVLRHHLIEQAFRDINTAANHTNYVEAAYAAIGSYFLTMDRDGGPEIAGRPFF